MLLRTESSATVLSISSIKLFVDVSHNWALHLFPANLGDSACISEIAQAISAVRQFGGRSGMIRQPQCRNWLHFYRITCRLSKIGREKVYMHEQMCNIRKQKGTLRKPCNNLEEKRTFTTLYAQYRPHTNVIVVTLRRQIANGPVPNLRVNSSNQR